MFHLMKANTVIVNNIKGIHARPAALLVETANRFQSDIYFMHKDCTYNCKSLLSILSLGLSYGTKITLMADGKDEEKAIVVVSELFESGFNICEDKTS